MVSSRQISMEEKQERSPECFPKKRQAGDGLGTAIAALFSPLGLQEDIPELRGHAALPAHFEEH